MASGQEVLTLRHAKAVNSVVFGPDGKRLVGGCGGQPGGGGAGEITIWDASKSMKQLE